MLKTLSLKTEGWVDRWGKLIFHYQEYLKTGDQENTITATEFLIGNLLTSYIVMFGCSFVFFAFYYKEPFLASAQADTIKDTGLASALFIAYVLANFIGLFISSILSYIVYSICQSNASFLSHVRSYFDTTAMEPLVAFSIVLAWLSISISQTSLLITAIVVFFLTRIWSLFIGFKSMEHIHRLPVIKKWFCFLLGYCPGMFLFNLLLSGIIWFFLVVIIVPNWD